MIGAILLAAGASRRFGGANKLLALLDGHPLVLHAARAVRAAGLPCLAVTGAEAGAVRAVLEGEVGGFVHATDWVEGMGRSIAAGIAAVPPHWTAALICLGDMPWVEPADLARIAAALTAPDSVAVPVHRGRRGNPVGFGRGWFARLVGLMGDQGARGLILDARVVEVGAGPGVLRDVDVAADLG